MSYSLLEAQEANIRYKELLNEIEQQRLIKRAIVRRPGFQVRALQNVGDALITLGRSLKSLSLSL